jgi:hypothetical protein
MGKIRRSTNLVANDWQLSAGTFIGPKNGQRFELSGAAVSEAVRRHRSDLVPAPDAERGIQNRHATVKDDHEW